MSSKAAAAAAATDCPKFCPNCNNYLYLQTRQVEANPEVQGATQKKTQLEKICHNCGFAKDCVTFFETSGTKKDIDTNDLKYDLTFMRTRAIKCPDKKCPGNEVLYLKKKPHEQTLLVVCCTCSKQFKYQSPADDDDDADDADDDGDADDDDGADDDDAMDEQEDNEEDESY